MTPELCDEELVSRVKAGETDLYPVIMRRYNRRIYRTVRGILGNDTEAEDVIQETYVRAFHHLDQFEGRAKFATWLTRIAVHEALARARRDSRFDELDGDALSSGLPSPEREASNAELRERLDAAVDALPVLYRSVFVLREIEGLSTAETADSLGVTTKTVKIRLHRARAFLRQELYAFHAVRCARVVAAVMTRLRYGVATA